MIDPKNKIIYRNDFTTALWQFVESYGEDLQNNKDDYRAAFKRKFDVLAQG